MIEIKAFFDGEEIFSMGVGTNESLIHKKVEEILAELNDDKDEIARKITEITNKRAPEKQDEDINMLLFGIIERGKAGLLPVSKIDTSEIVLFRFGQYETHNLEECYDIVEKVTGRNYADEYDEDYFAFIRFLYETYPTMVHVE